MFDWIKRMFTTKATDAPAPEAPYKLEPQTHAGPETQEAVSVPAPPKQQPKKHATRAAPKNKNTRPNAAKKSDRNDRGQK